MDVLSVDEVALLDELEVGHVLNGERLDQERRSVLWDDESRSLPLVSDPCRVDLVRQRLVPFVVLYLCREAVVGIEDQVVTLACGFMLDLMQPVAARLQGVNAVGSGIERRMVGHVAAQSSFEIKGHVALPHARSQEYGVCYAVLQVIGLPLNVFLMQQRRHQVFLHDQNTLF